ncbi:3-keto-disaccharide hydrolase [Tundrisphaera sp. TA3]|uniref:3-keto-disaccharide hydrolase n=1 Tax=Tundrisphaera sp. TA3 TaxID=3435775 RepID=UPI003EB6FB1A
MRPVTMGWAGAGAMFLALAGMAAAADFYGDISGVKLARPEDKVDAPTVPPPPGSVVLFDGSNLDAWMRADGKGPAAWPVLPGGVMQVQGQSIRTRDAFDGHFRLHVEFRVPYMPDKAGQGRGNSGVYLQGRYEVQILDSYGLDSQDNDCGGIYKVARPLANACKAPTVWQSYDIDFQAPRFADGKKVAPARISVTQNGTPIHRDVAIPLDNTVAGMGGDPSTPGPIMLQDHGNPVQYRNIWLQMLD